MMRRSTRTLLIALGSAALCFGGLRSAASPAAPSKGPATDDQPPVQVFLSWRAPYGQPRAKQAIMAPCGRDSSVRDTLWVSFVAARSWPTLYGVGMHFRFRAVAGDTLGPYWWLGQGGPPRLEIQYPDPDAWGYRRPWNVNGPAFPYFERTPNTFRLVITYIVNADSAGSVEAGVPYVLARMIFKRPTPDLPRCDQPICIEWSDSEFAFTTETGAANHAPGGQRYVTWNSPRGDACSEFTSSRAAPQPWKPKPGTR